MIRSRFKALPAEERKALTMCVFAASCICFAPAELISGTLLLLASFALYRWDGQVLAEEQAAAAERAPADAPPVAEGEAPTSDG